jgi:tRNA (guanine-N7-)-methyltransferase
MRGPPDFESPLLLDLDSLATTSEGSADWDEVFGRSKPLRVEVGVGNSPFLIDLALLEPDFNYLGIEYSLKRVLKFLKKVHTADVDCIRMANQNSDLIFGSLIRQPNVDHIFVNFPDPWRKYRHRRKRFVREERMRIVCDLLRSGGGFSFRTDAKKYAEEALEVLEGIDVLENVGGAPGGYAERPAYPFETQYESRFKIKGLPIYYFEYRKR